VKVLFDHNVPRKLRHALTEHVVTTADEMGWSTLENGDLLRVAEAARYDVMVTCDKNLSYQQNLQQRLIGMIVLSTNDWNVLKLRTALVVEAVASSQIGSFQLLLID
jgi:predicted nuclease of predicted toxin-antitoxin system